MSSVSLSPSLTAGDAHAAGRPDHVLHEVGRLAHHRPPARLVPADRPVGEADLQLAVVVHARHELVGEPGPDRRHPHRLGAGHLAHHVDVVHAAVDDRRHRVHQGLVGLPHLARRLLVEVHPHHQRLAERAGGLDEPLPGGMDPEDVADHELLARLPGRRHDLLRLGHRHRHRLLEKDVAAGLEGGLGVCGVGVGVGVDRDGVGRGGGEGLVIVGELRIVRTDRIEQGPPRRLATGDDAHDLEAGHVVVGLGVRGAHVAAAGDENPDRRGCHWCEFLARKEKAVAERKAERDMNTSVTSRAAGPFRRPPGPPPG